MEVSYEIDPHGGIFDSMGLTTQGYQLTVNANSISDLLDYLKDPEARLDYLRSLAEPSDLPIDLEVSPDINVDSK